MFVPATVATTIGGILGVIVLWLLPAIGVAKLAERKGRSFGLWLAASLVFSWVWFLVAAMIIRPTPGSPTTT